MKKTLLIIAAIFTIIQFNAFAQTELWEILANHNEIKMTSVSADGKLFAFSDGRYLKVINIETGKLILLKSSTGINDIEFSSENNELGVLQSSTKSYEKMFLEIYDMDNIENIKYYKLDSSNTYIEAKLSKDLKYFGALDESKRCRVFDVETNEEVWVTTGATWGHDFEFSTDSKSIILAGALNMWKINIQSNEFEWETEMEGTNLSDITMTNDGKYIIYFKGIGSLSSLTYAKIYIFNQISGEYIQQLPILTKDISVSDNPINERILALDNENYNVYEWEIANDEYERLIAEGDNDFAQYVIFNDTTHIICGKKNVNLIDYETLSLEKTLMDSLYAYDNILNRPSDFVYGTNEILLGGSHRGAAFNANSGIKIKNIENKFDGFLPRVNKYFSYEINGGNSVIKIYDYDNGNQIESFELKELTVYLVFSNDMKYCFYLSGPVDSKVIDWKTKEIIWEYKGESLDDSQRLIGFSNDNKYLLTGTFDYPFQLRNLLSGEIVLDTTFLNDNGIGGTTTFFMFNSENKIALLDTNEIFNIIDIESASIVKQIDLAREDESIGGVALSPNDEYLIKGTRDNKIYVYNIETGEEVFNYKKYGHAIGHVIMSPDNKKMMVIYTDHTTTMLDIEGALSVEEIETNKTELALFPNPCQSELYIDLQGFSFTNATIGIYNLLGEELRRIENVNPGMTAIDMQGLPSGVYNVVLRSGEKVLVGKVVKEN